MLIERGEAIDYSTVVDRGNRVDVLTVGVSDSNHEGSIAGCISKMACGPIITRRDRDLPVVEVSQRARLCYHTV